MRRLAQSAVTTDTMKATALFLTVTALVISPLHVATGGEPAPIKLSEAPFPYVWAEAHYVLPETTSEESGYFSLCEGLDKNIYVGTAKYNTNAFLVEFAPRTRKQRIVLDTHKVCDLHATGYAAQSKLHTRNYVGRSGKIYVGSKQGYRLKGDTAEYAGGYAMTYDPKTGRAENLGRPFPGQGVIDVVADEKRGLLYVVTCEDQHWMKSGLSGGKYEELGPMLTPYATTLVDKRGRAHAITKNFQMATYDPATGTMSVRDILLDGIKWTRANAEAIPTWDLARDGRTAWLILMNDANLIELDLGGSLGVVQAQSRGRMVEGKSPDCRSALRLAPDGRIYAVVRVDNTTAFGKGHLHHLTRYHPKKRKMEDLGVLAVKNPDFFDFGPGPDGQKKGWTHGFHTLPDGTLTPLHAHMSLIVAHDGTIYVTILYPFTLLKIAKPK